jgi:hypothetical protein
MLIALPRRSIICQQPVSPHDHAGWSQLKPVQQCSDKAQGL